MAWTIKDIKKRIFDLETRKKSIKNPNKLFQIDQTIASLYEIIDYMSSEVIDSKYSIKRIVNDDRKYINAHLPYTSMVDGFATSYQDKETIIEFKPDYVQIADMSKDKVCSVTKDVYDTIKDERFTTPFLELFKSRFHYLNYVKKPKVTSHGNEAVTLPVYNTRDVYIHMYRSGDIHDFLASIHEYGHAITALINQDFRFEYGKSLFIETDGIFFEMIGNDYLGDNEVDKEQSLVADIDRFYDFVYYAVVIQTKLNMHNDFNNLRKATEDQMLDYIHNKARLQDEDSIDEILHTPISEIYHYVTSYLMAIELYMLYKNDPNKALSALHDLITFDSNSNQETMDMLKDKYGIVVSEHVHEYYLSLIKRVEEVQNGKGIQHTIK